MQNRKSAQLFKNAKKVIPGGVNSPVRAFKSVGAKPIFIHKAKGPFLFDEDGNRYIDCCLSCFPASPENVMAERGHAAHVRHRSPQLLESELSVHGQCALR